MSQPLLQRNTRILLTWLPLILLVSSVLFYVMMSMQVHHMQKKQLLLKQYNIWNAFIAKSGNIEHHIAGEYDIEPGNSKAPITFSGPRDTLLFYYGNSGKGEKLPFQVLTRDMSWSGQAYRVTTYVSSNEIFHLIIKVFVTEVVVFLLLLAAIIILNRRSSGRLWQSFFTTMNRVNEYDITKHSPPELPSQTGIAEFDELNIVLNRLIGHVNGAYFSQKQFVENASHETQTPLAIIRSKLELLINQPHITEREATLLADITSATNRLSQMNRTLLLLAKIENHQFPDTEEVDIAEILWEALGNFSEHYEHAPEVTANIGNPVTVRANRSLMEIFISNLVNNAFVHNRRGGKIHVTLESGRLQIENTGEPLTVAPQELFERFKKGLHQKKTTGLGLSLVKEISQLYNYRVSYTYNEGWHRVDVVFRQ